jgi:hypothetical protein
MKSIVVANLVLLSIFIPLLQQDSYAQQQVQNITYHDCELPITNVGIIDVRNIFGSGIQIMGNVHNNHTHLVENLSVVAELYDGQNNLIGIEDAGTPSTTPPLPSVQPQEHTPFKTVFPIQANTSMIGSVFQ